MAAHFSRIEAKVLIRSYIFRLLVTQLVSFPTFLPLFHSVLATLSSLFLLGCARNFSSLCLSTVSDKNTLNYQTPSASSFHSNAIFPKRPLLDILFKIAATLFPVPALQIPYLALSLFFSFALHLKSCNTLFNLPIYHTYCLLTASTSSHFHWNITSTGAEILVCFVH